MSGKHHSTARRVVVARSPSLELLHKVAATHSGLNAVPGVTHLCVTHNTDGCGACWRGSQVKDWRHSIDQDNEELSSIHICDLCRFDDPYKQCYFVH